MSEKRIYVAIDNVADGPMLIDDKKKLLPEIQQKYPNCVSAVPHSKDSDVVVCSTKKKK